VFAIRWSPPRRCSTGRRTGCGIIFEMSARDRFVGKWRLASMVARAEDGTVIYPYGPDALGYLLYTAGGWMTTTVARSDWPNTSANNLADAAGVGNTVTNSGYVNYCADYEVYEDFVVHAISMSLLPRLLGTRQRRYFEFNADELTLRAPDAEINGAKMALEVHWNRDE
jgi:Lipocalin-like domain